MSKKTYSIEVPWEAPSGVTYTIPVKVVTVTDSNYGADADGNRGVSAFFIDDIALDCTEAELKSAISDPEDFSFFDLDFISEEVEEEISNLRAEE